jgi:hypothetical protein
MYTPYIYKSAIIVYNIFKIGNIMRYIKFLTLFLFMLTPLLASKKIIVDLHGQRAYAFENNKNVFSGRISSGKKGRRTPLGVFSILEKKRKHTSNLWPKPKGGAKMPYMMRLTYGGIAMHLGYVPKYPASHGCVRLKSGFAQKLYAWASVGTAVEVVKRYKRKKVAFKQKINRKKRTNILESPVKVEKKKREYSASYIEYIKEKRRMNPYQFDDTLEMLQSTN